METPAVPQRHVSNREPYFHFTGSPRHVCVSRYIIPYVPAQALIPPLYKADQLSYCLLIFSLHSLLTSLCTILDQYIRLRASVCTLYNERHTYLRTNTSYLRRAHRLPAHPLVLDIRHSPSITWHNYKNCQNCYK